MQNPATKYDKCRLICAICRFGPTSVNSNEIAAYMQDDFPDIVLDSMIDNFKNTTQELANNHFLGTWKDWKECRKIFDQYESIALQVQGKTITAAKVRDGTVRGTGCNLTVY